MSRSIPGYMRTHAENLTPNPHKRIAILSAIYGAFLSPLDSEKDKLCCSTLIDWFGLLAFHCYCVIRPEWERADRNSYEATLA